MMVSTLYPLRNSAAEVLALVMEEMYPKITLLQGGHTEQGFYYEFLSEMPLAPHNLILIEEKMRGTIKKDLAIESLSMMRENAIELFRHRKQRIKAQQASTATTPVIAVVRIDKFFDLCDEPLECSTKPLSFFKLLSLEPITYFSPAEGNLNAYRISGSIAQDPKDLKKIVKNYESLKRNGFRTVAEKMELFTFSEDFGKMAWFWHPNGLSLKDALLQLWKDGLLSNGYRFVSSPAMVKKSSSGEKNALVNIYDKGIEYCIPASLTPSHIALYRAHPQHKKIAECALVHCPFSDASFQGLLPPLVHADYATSFCFGDEVEKEGFYSLQFIDKNSKMFAFGTRWQIVRRGKKSSGTTEEWEKYQAMLLRALKACGIEAEETAETASTGPKLQCILEDSLGREWRGPSISLSLGTEKLGLRCRREGGTMESPVIMTTQLFGSLERFIGILAEHVRGEWPQWLLPK